MNVCVWVVVVCVCVHANVCVYGWVCVKERYPRIADIKGLL